MSIDLADLRYFGEILGQPEPSLWVSDPGMNAISLEPPSLTALPSVPGIDYLLLDFDASPSTS
jgi:hypothetical protein